MSTQIEKAEQFGRLHIVGHPIVFYNIWDAGSAKVVVEQGASAVATGSASVAEAQGYDDGELIPLDLLLKIAQQIVNTVDVPVSIDFEGGFAEGPEQLYTHTQRLLQTGVVGINFEDQKVGETELYSIDIQIARIKAIRQAAEDIGVNLYINSRTDLFLKAESSEHSKWISEAVERASKYAEAGASGFFVPGLREIGHIKTIAKSVSLPLNVMAVANGPSVSELAEAGVARISYGTRPYREHMHRFAEQYLKDIVS